MPRSNPLLLLIHILFLALRKKTSLTIPCNKTSGEEGGAEKKTERQKNPKQESHAPRFALMELFSSASCANTRKI